MKILLLTLITPFLLGNSAGGLAMMLPGLLAVVAIFGIVGLLVWYAVKLLG
jgi:hypothetical protein